MFFSVTAVGKSCGSNGPVEAGTGSRTVMVVGLGA